MKYLTQLTYRRKFNSEHYERQIAKRNDPDFPKDNLYMWTNIETGKILPHYNPVPPVKTITSEDTKKLEAIVARHCHNWDWHKFSTIKNKENHHD